MSGIGGRKLLIRVVALMLAFAVAACAIPLRGNDDTRPAWSSETRASGEGIAEPGRCRSTAPEQPADVRLCRRIPAESRRRLLIRKAPPAPPVDSYSLHTE